MVGGAVCDKGPPVFRVAVFQDVGPLWVCLTCCSVGCGQSSDGQHGLAHFDDKGHAVVVCPETMQCWCVQHAALGMLDRLSSPPPVASELPSSRCYKCDDHVLNEDDMLEEVRSLLFGLMRDGQSDPEPDGEHLIPGAASPKLDELPPVRGVCSGIILLTARTFPSACISA